MVQSAVDATVFAWRGPMDFVFHRGLAARRAALTPRTPAELLRTVMPHRGPLLETLEATPRDAAFFVAFSPTDALGAIDASKLPALFAPRSFLRYVVKDDGAEERFLRMFPDAKTFRAGLDVAADRPLYIVDLVPPLVDLSALADREFVHPASVVWRVRTSSP